MNPENFIRSPRRTPKVAPVPAFAVEQEVTKARAKDIADDDRSFQPFNSELYRDHANKVEQMALRNEGPQDHPIVFQYNGGDYRRSYFQPYEYSAVERSRMAKSFNYSQSPARLHHYTPWKK